MLDGDGEQSVGPGCLVRVFGSGRLAPRPPRLDSSLICNVTFLIRLRTWKGRHAGRDSSVHACTWAGSYTVGLWTSCSRTEKYALLGSWIREVSAALMDGSFWPFVDVHRWQWAAGQNVESPASRQQFGGKVVLSILLWLFYLRALSAGTNSSAPMIPSRMTLPSRPAFEYTSLMVLT